MKTLLWLLASAIKRVAWCGAVLSEIALLGLLLLVMHEVLSRYIFDRPTTFSVEISEYLLVFLALMSAGWVLHEDRHVRMPVFVQLLPRRWRLGLDIFTSVLITVFCAILVWKGWASMATAYTGNYHSSSLLNFPLWIPYSFVPLGGLILGAQYLVHIGETVQALKAPQANR